MLEEVNLTFLWRGLILGPRIYELRGAGDFITSSYVDEELYAPIRIKGIGSNLMFFNIPSGSLSTSTS